MTHFHEKALKHLNPDTKPPSAFEDQFPNSLHIRQGQNPTKSLVPCSSFYMPTMQTPPHAHKYLILPNPDRKCPRQ